MEIVLIAGDKKKELMVEFCTAYCGAPPGKLQNIYPKRPV